MVEDDDVLRGIIVRNLEARGHDVKAVSTASDAIASATADKPDLLLLDILLPDRTGWDVLRSLEDKTLAVVIVSATKVSPDRLGEFKPLAYLPKPFPLEALLRIVEEPDTDDAGIIPVASR